VELGHASNTIICNSQPAASAATTPSKQNENLNHDQERILKVPPAKKNLESKICNDQNDEVKRLFRTEEEKKKHEQVIHAAGKKGKKPKCIFCGLFTHSMWNHLKNKHNSQLPHAFKCTFNCSKFAYFLTEDELAEHISRVHTKRALVRKEVKCIYCKKILLDSNLLNAHVKYFHYEYKLKCKFNGCCRYFLTQIRADAHFEQRHRKKEEQKIFKCSKCDFRSARKDGVEGHETRSHADKTVPCPKCEKMFGSIKIMNSHLIGHKEPQMCEHCNDKISILTIRGHQMQEQCKNCQEVFLCVKLARLHNKTCKPVVSNSNCL
jgi:hypothetical protein